MISQFIFFVLATISTFNYVSAHGHIQNPLAITGVGDFIVSRGQNNACGLVNLQSIRASSNGGTPRLVVPGSTTQFIYRISNQDGAGGTMRIRFDPTGTGTNFNLNADVIQDAPGQNGRVPATSTFPMDVPVRFVVPAALNCDLCLVQFLNPIGFGSCAWVSTNPARGTPN
ncbi:hypothetical protein HMI54_010132 [Coelomomyces lativittatus]|nr:hypothetical protein HMI54_010132 [Coelomomyces lativittatus]KAJ1505555.1 hypothetical protein HMI56_001063 [Coelomomyces lativittatus]KAJ1514363.1 hypothetical protein HMI55_004725 [Coelomomyces lativittatus]